MGKKTITMVKYQDLGLLRYNETIEMVEEVPLINRPLFFEYMDGEVNIEQFIQKKYDSIRNNCLGDYILIDIYAIMLGEDEYNNMLKVVKGNNNLVIKNLFGNLFFVEGGPVIHQGFYRYPLSSKINIDKI